MNEQEEFLKDISANEGTEDLFSQPLHPEQGQPEGEKAPQPEAEGNEGEPELKNRRERRLYQKWQSEREAGIRMAARLEALSEAKNFRSESEPSEYLASVERIYGTNSPEAKEATELLARALQGVEQRATEKALELFRQEQEEATKAVSREEENLESMIDDIESEFGVSLSEADQKEFFRRLEKVSPKDSDGNIIAFADPFGVWEDVQARKTPQNSRAKEIASRGMNRTAASPAPAAGTDPNEEWLKQNGII